RDDGRVDCCGGRRGARVPAAARRRGAVPAVVARGGASPARGAAVARDPVVRRAAGGDRPPRRVEGAPPPRRAGSVSDRSWFLRSLTLPARLITHPPVAHAPSPPRHPP